jgi:hypothetical protein
MVEVMGIQATTLNGGRTNNLFQEFVDLPHSLQMLFSYYIGFVDFIVIDCHEGWNSFLM